MQTPGNVNSFAGRSRGDSFAPLLHPGKQRERFVVFVLTYPSRCVPSDQVGESVRVTIPAPEKMPAKHSHRFHTSVNQRSTQSSLSRAFGLLGPLLLMLREVVIRNHHFTPARYVVIASNGSIACFMVRIVSYCNRTTYGNTICESFHNDHIFGSGGVEAGPVAATALCHKALPGMRLRARFALTRSAHSDSARESIAAALRLRIARRHR